MEDNITIWHNPRCRKSREGLAYLTETLKVEPEVFLYLEKEISEKEMENVLNLLSVEPLELVRKNEADYKDNFKGKDLSKAEWIKAFIQYPKLIERPIVIRKNKAVIARPAEEIKKLF